MKKKIIAVVSILLILIVAITMAVAFKTRHSENDDKKEKTKESTNAVPVIRVLYDTEVVGKIEGYTMDMKESHMRDVIIPIAPSRTVPLKITVNDNEIKSISYELKDFKEDKLIDSGIMEKWNKKNSQVIVDYQASAIMEEGKEYFLKFVLVTDKHEKINYYTRAMVMNREFVPEQIAFAKNFSEDTFSEEEGMKLSAYLEPNSQYASDSLGQVTIRSNIGMLIWKTLRPEKTVKTEVSMKDICIKDSGEAGTYTLTYEIKATNAQKKEEKYNVAETITVWSFQGKNYVLAYNREVNQQWECDESNIGSAFIDLGIQKQSSIEHVESDNGEFISYEINGDVYVMDILKKKICAVFQLNAGDVETIYKTKVKVMSVSDQGDVEYLIYGYSPSDEHVGKNGISVMNYSWEDKTSKESAFIPCNEPAQILENEMDGLCYEGDGTVYIMISNTVYFANLKTKEWGTLVENIEEGGCVANSAGSVIAYNTNGSLYDSDSITIVNLRNGKKQEITENGKKVTVCGYTGDNLVYGLADAEMKKKYSGFPMSTLKIVDKDLKEIKVYKKAGITLSDVVVTDTVISFNRWKNNKKIDEEQLLNNLEEKQAVAKPSYYMDDVKMRELALAFINNLDANIELGISPLGTVRFNSNTELKADFVKQKGKRFYVYGYGKLQGIYTNQKEAENAAKETYGLVVNDKGAKIWTFEENYNND